DAVFPLSAGDFLRAVCALFDFGPADDEVWTSGGPAYGNCGAQSHLVGCGGRGDGCAYRGGLVEQEGGEGSFRVIVKRGGGGGVGGGGSGMSGPQESSPTLAKSGLGWGTRASLCST